MKKTTKEKRLQSKPVKAGINIDAIKIPPTVITLITDG